jgi:hypothetical protein
MTLLRGKGQAVRKRPVLPGRSKPRLHRRQPAEKPPRQPRVVDQDNSLSFGNHGGYIANQPGFDNESGVHEKGADMRPLYAALMACS